MVSKMECILASMFDRFLSSFWSQVRLENRPNRSKKASNKTMQKQNGLRWPKKGKNLLQGVRRTRGGATRARRSNYNFPSVPRQTTFKETNEQKTSPGCSDTLSASGPTNSRFRSCEILRYSFIQKLCVERMMHTHPHLFLAQHVTTCHVGPLSIRLYIAWHCPSSLQETAHTLRIRQKQIVFQIGSGARESIPL